LFVITSPPFPNRNRKFNPATVRKSLIDLFTKYYASCSQERDEMYQFVLQQCKELNHIYVSAAQQFQEKGDLPDDMNSLQNTLLSLSSIVVSSNKEREEEEKKD
jgi:hypothetical protein